MQPTGRSVPSSAWALIAAGDQWNVGWCGREPEGPQLMHMTLGGQTDSGSREGIVRPRDLTLFIGVLSLWGCSDPDVCTEEVRRAVEVEVRDAESDGYIADLTRGVVRDGAFEDSLRLVGWIGGDPALGTVLGGADERPGIYSVSLEAEGWKPWDTSGVVVASDACHVSTATLTARLQRAP